MLTHFKIDGQLLKVSDVLEGKLQTRFPLSYLELVADFRAWDGKPHVTDLFNGTRIMWLKNKTDFAVDPDDAAYRVFGVQAHGKLELTKNDSDIAELSLETDEIQGRTDLVGMVNGELSVIDYKVIGSYKIQQALGLYYESEGVVDGDGKPVCNKTGAKKGLQKTRKVLKQDPAKADVKDFTRQLNIYRYLIKKIKGLDIQKLYVFAIVRDGGTISATQRGVLKKTYTFPIKVAGDSFVEKYITERSAAICAAMSGDIAPALCSAEECWQGMRCQKYCEVSEACARLGDNPYIRSDDFVEGAEEDDNADA